MVLLVTPRSWSFFRIAPTCSSCSIILARTTSVSARPSSTAICTYFGLGCEQTWMAVELNHRKKGLARAIHPLNRFREHLRVKGFRALPGEGACVLDLLLADPSELRIRGRVVHLGRPGMEDAARAELLLV